MDEKPQGTVTTDMFKELCTIVSLQCKVWCRVRVNIVENMVQGQGRYCGGYAAGVGDVGIPSVCCDHH